MNNLTKEKLFFKVAFQNKTYSSSGVVGVLQVVLAYVMCDALFVLCTKRSAGTEILRPKSDDNGGPRRSLRCLLKIKI